MRFQRDRPGRSHKLTVIISIFIIIIITQYYLYRNAINELYPLICPYSYTITEKRIIFDNPSYTIQHYPEFICPQNFRNMADWIYGWPENVFDEQVQNSIYNLRETLAYLPHGSIVFVKSDFLSGFFLDVYPHFQNKFVLITGQGDKHVPGKYLDYLIKTDSKIIHWFGQNGDINASTSERFTHIPIGKDISFQKEAVVVYTVPGINCFEMAESIRDVHRQYPSSTLPPVVNQSIDEPSHYIQPFDITRSVLKDKGQADKIVLLNFSPNTDRSGLRKKLWNDICKTDQNSFAICFDKPDGVDISSLLNVYKRNRQYPLWLSPRGNGLDCHRTWEALYLDAIPIVWHSTLDSLYTDLPIIIINDWSDLNEEFLRKKLYEISLKKLQQPSVYQYDKLRSAFWHQMILKKSRYAFLDTPTQRNRCWRAKTTS